MKSLEINFFRISQKKPFLSSYSVFAEAVAHRYFSDKTIHHWFGLLVDRKDYSRGDKLSILEQLVKLSNTP